MDHLRPSPDLVNTMGHTHGAGPVRVRVPHATALTQSPSSAPGHPPPRHLAPAPHPPPRPARAPCPTSRSRADPFKIDVTKLKIGYQISTSPGAPPPAALAIVTALGAQMVPINMTFGDSGNIDNTALGFLTQMVYGIEVRYCPDGRGRLLCGRGGGGAVGTPCSLPPRLQHSFAASRGGQMGWGGGRAFLKAGRGTPDPKHSCSLCVPYQPC